MEEDLWDSFYHNAGLSKLREYAQTHQMKKESIELRRYILRVIEEFTAGGKDSSDYREAKELLRL